MNSGTGGRILVVDDDHQLRRVIRLLLERHGYTVRDVETASEALEEFSRFKPDVLVLDVLLPDMSGVEVCRRIRAMHHEPIIILSAVGDEETKIAALDAGADDYVTKPIGAGELLARIRVALRRGATDRMRAPIIIADGLRIDLEHHRVDVDDRQVHLTPTEFSLLRYLATNRGRLVTHSMILEAVWGEAHVEDRRILRTYINQLRSKLGDDGRVQRFILTEAGIGYRFADTVQL